jgi:outer membrane receptor protein involved in Fe transport
MRKIALILILLITLCVTGLFAGTTGKLAGRVKDESGKGLAYVNVIVTQDGRRVTGIQSKDNGSYIIINIPPGVYDVKYQLMGFAETSVTGVRINVDQTTTQNTTLVKKSVVIDRVVVTAQQDKVAKDPTGSERRIDTSNLSTMAINDVQGIVALQAGASVVAGELHIRGGRANEVNYSIDGMSVSDPVDGGAALQVDTDAISDMKVMTGGFTAEYGNAQSGQVAIITKEGDNYYSGKVEWSTDRYIAESRNEDAIKFALGGPVIPFSSDDLKNRFTFYLNGAGDWQDGRLRNYAIGDPNADFVYVDSLGVEHSLLGLDYAAVNPFADRKKLFGKKLFGFIPDVDVGNRFYNSYNVNLKTKFALNEIQKLTAAVRGDRSVNDFFSYGWKYAPDFNGIDETEQRQYVLTYDHVLSPTMNLKLKGSYFQKDYYQAPKGIDTKNYFFYTIPEQYRVPRPETLPANYTEETLNAAWGFGYESVDNNENGIYDGMESTDPNWWLYQIPNIGENNQRAITGFAQPGTIADNLVNDKTASTQFKADFEWQINETHQAKSGLELIKHSIKKDQIAGFLTRDRKRFTDYLNAIYNISNYVDPDTTDGIIYVPEQLADVYITDDGTPIAIYYPYDYYNAAYAASGQTDGYKANPWSGAYYLQDKMEWEGMIVNAGLRFDFWYLGSNYQIALDNGKYRTSDLADKDKFRINVSPRLGVSHPISDRDVLRFAYNYQNQLPQMQYIFTSKDSTDAITNPGTTVGNPNLEPQITITYEVGLTHQLSEDYVIDMTAYYKNLYNYVSTKKVQAEEATVFWYEFISEDYGSARGLDIQLEKSLSDFNTWSVSYSLAWAQGNNSATVIQDEATNLREFPLDWDIRHNVNVNYTFRIARGEEYIIPFTNLILPLDDFTTNFTWTMASGTPYTPTSGPQNTALDTNSKRKGITQQANLRLTKGFVIPGGAYLRLYMDVENLFKFSNIGGVFSKTGSAYYDGADLSEDIGVPGSDPFTYPEVQFMHNKAVLNPGNVNNFRAVTLGVSFNF